MKILPGGSWKALLLCCLTAACSRATPAPVTTAETPGTALLIGAGDVARCPGNEPAGLTGDLIRRYPAATVFVAGDLAYENATAEELRDCYDPVWGSFKERSRPAPGNHEYGIYPPVHRNNAVPYFEYFGPNAGPPGKGYYSYDLGSWHVVSLNSMAGEVPSAPSMQEQTEWLEADLAATDKPCVLAYWHHPLFSSDPPEPEDPGTRMGPLWQILHRHHADVVLNGHYHFYERFALQDPKGDPDPQGIRQFTVGNGGAETFQVEGRLATSEVRLDGKQDFGVLLLKLHPDSYEWEFLKTDGTVGDRSAARHGCH